jgi:hypothetical protein
VLSGGNLTLNGDAPSIELKKTDQSAKRRVRRYDLAQVVRQPRSDQPN